MGIRVGLIVDEGAQPFLVWDLVAKSRTSQAYCISALIVQKAPTQVSPVKNLNQMESIRKFRSRVDRRIFRAIAQLEECRLKVRPELAQTLNCVSLESLGIPTFEINPEVSASGLVYRWTDEDLALVETLDLDVLVRCGRGILKGSVLSICPLGVLSFHHGDNRINRGMPAAFWEVLGRCPSTGFVIQRLTEELDGGAIIFRGAIPTAATYVRNSTQLYLKSNVFMHQMLERIGLTGRLPESIPSTPYSQRLFRSPTGRVLAKYVKHLFLHFSGKFRMKLLRKVPNWSIAWMRVSKWEEAVLWKSSSIPNPKGRFLADPMLLSRSGRHYMFVEDFEFESSKGRIGCLEWNGTEWVNLGVVLEEPFHLSYPFTFEYDGEILMCPESSAANDIRLYRATNFPHSWELHKVLKQNIRAADSSLVCYQGRWWLFSNVDSSGVGEHNSELHLFHSASPDSDSWIAHQGNPVIFDSGRARNGGLFVANGNIYRVFQRHGYDCYGQSMGIAVVTEIGENEYMEEEICHLTADFVDDAIGTHTFSTLQEGFVAVDVLRKSRM